MDYPSTRKPVDQREFIATAFAIDVRSYLDKHLDVDVTCSCVCVCVYVSDLYIIFLTLSKGCARHTACRFFTNSFFFLFYTGIVDIVFSSSFTSFFEYIGIRSVEKMLSIRKRLILSQLRC